MDLGDIPVRLGVALLLGPLIAVERECRPHAIVINLIQSRRGRRSVKLSNGANRPSVPTTS